MAEVSKNAGVHNMRILWDEPIEMDDGVELRANVYLPLEEGRYPVVMAMTIYGKDLPFSQGFAGAWDEVLKVAPEVAVGTTTKFISFEAPDPEKWTPHGYAVALMDARGSGRSPGSLTTFSAREAMDYRDAIEWAGAQNWSSGAVGLLGMSYLGRTQWAAAGMQPRHLRAIIPWEAGTDYLRAHGYHGGIPSTFLRDWYQSQVKSVQHGLGCRGFRNIFSGVLVSGDTDLTEAELAHNSAATDIFRQLMEHPLDDGFYDGGRPSLERITVPLLSVSSWGAVGSHLRGNIEGFVRSSSAEKWLWIRESKGSFAGFYGDEGVTAQREFFDATLKASGEPSRTQPKVRLSIRDVEDETVKTVEAREWPVEDTQWWKLYLDAERLELVSAPPASEARSTWLGSGDGITLKTPPLGGTTEVVGPLAAKLWVSSSTTDADLFLTVRVFAPDESEKFFHGLPDPKIPLTQGWLRCSQREIDAARSTDYWPVLSHRTVRPLWPGEPYCVDIEIWPTSVILSHGCRLGLTIAGRDFDHGDPFVWSKSGVELRGSSLWLHDDPRYRPKEIYGGDVTLYTGGDRLSHLVIPTMRND